MPPHSSQDGSSRSKRRSLFALSSLTKIDPSVPEEQQGGGSTYSKLRKKRAPSVSEIAEQQEQEAPDNRESYPSPQSLQSSPNKPRRPSLSVRSNMPRPTSVFGSLKTMRSHGDDEPTSANSSKNQSYQFAQMDVSSGPNKTVIHHGEVQTSSSVFRKKKEYLVLTDTHIVRCKSQSKAAESFHNIPPPLGRSPTMRHSSSQSVGSTQDAHSFGSDSSGDKEGRTPLRQVVAVHAQEDGRPYFALEICYLDEESNQASAMTLQFNHPDERDTWIRCIRSAATKMRSLDPRPASNYNANYAARTVEREGDYDPSRFHLFKVIQRQFPKAAGRSSTDDLSKIASIVCFLAIGIHKVHIIPLPKASSRTSSPALSQSAHGSYGILTISAVKLTARDDSIELTFRQPLKRPKILYLASVAAPDIALKLHYVEHYLRPECAHWLYKFLVPPELEAQADVAIDPDEEEHSCLDRTLTAYCIAYDVNPAKIRYTINYDCEDAPRFELLPTADSRRIDYSPSELLAILRALRYNESFASISFQDIRLDSLHGLYDTHGVEYVCVRTKRGTPLKLTQGELNKASLLVQEIRAIAVTSKRLRRLDFSRSISIQPPEATDDDYRVKDSGCGVVEALLPLCRHQTTNVDWITLNGITLSEADLDYLVGAAVDRNCHFRALELSRCGLGDRTLGLVLDALRAHDNTLEALDISGNLARLSPNVFDGQIGVFGFIRCLDVSNLPRTSGPESLISADTLLTWRLETLKLSGIQMNERTVQALATYLRSSRSSTLKELMLDNAYLSGKDIATLMHALQGRSGESRNLHLDISHNKIYRDHDELCKAFIAGHSPTHVTLRAMEYRDELVLRNILNAVRQNHSTRFLDISRASLPGDASEETSNALQRLFAENDTLEILDISGEDSRLETSKFGSGLNRALQGLKYNRVLQVLRIQYQKLGILGASTLADVIKENEALREVYCEQNDIPLSAFTDLVNALHKNTSIIYLPMMDEGRAMALKQTEKQVKLIRDEASLSHPPPSSPLSKASHLGMRRGIATVKRHTSRATSASTPSFPSLASPDHRSTSNPTTSSPKKAAAHHQSATAPLPQLSEQDILAALRLVAESWDRQQYRLQQYLQRNWSILQGINVPMDIAEEDFERPSSVVSLSNVLQQVKLDATPTAEREAPVYQLPGERRESTGSAGRRTSLGALHIDTSPARARGDTVGSATSNSSNGSVIRMAPAPQRNMDSLLARARDVMPGSPTVATAAALSVALGDGYEEVEPVSPISAPGSPVWSGGGESGGISPIEEGEERLEMFGLGIKDESRSGSYASPRSGSYASPRSGDYSSPRSGSYASAKS